MSSEQPRAVRITKRAGFPFLCLKEQRFQQSDREQPSFMARIIMLSPSGLLSPASHVQPACCLFELHSSPSVWTHLGGPSPRLVVGVERGQGWPPCAQPYPSLSEAGSGQRAGPGGGTLSFAVLFCCMSWDVQVRQQQSNNC